MKNFKLFIIAATCFMSFNLLAQNAEKSSRLIQYGYVGFESGYLYGIDEAYFSPAATIGFKNGFELSVDYKNVNIDDPNFANYSTGIPGIIHAYEKHGININVISFDFGKSIYSNEKMRIVLLGGPSYINSYRYDSSGASFMILESHESSQTFNQNTIGFDIKAKFDLTAADVIGVSLVLDANLNEIENYYGAGLAFNFGKMK